MTAFNETKYRNLSYSKPEGKYCNDESDFDQKQQVIFCGRFAKCFILVLQVRGAFKIFFWKKLGIWPNKGGGV